MEMDLSTVGSSNQTIEFGFMVSTMLNLKSKSKLQVSIFGCVGGTRRPPTGNQSTVRYNNFIFAYNVLNIVV